MAAVDSSLSARILVGTASWSDPGFVERWYPKKLPAAERLPWYAQHFDLVELNSSFYAIPDRRMVERWCASTPNEFIFDVKVHKLLSRHAADLKSLPPTLQRSVEADARGKVKLTPKTERAVLEEVMRSVEPMRAAGKFGAFLLQLSPAFSPRKHDLAELEEVIGRLGGSGLVVELRNRNWMIGEQLPQTLEFFRERQTTLCLVDAPNEEHFTIMPSEVNDITSSRLAYLRLHGRNAEGYLHGKTVAERFYYDYSDAEIDELTKRAKKLAGEAEKVHVIFNNNALDFAPHAAARMRKALGQLVKSHLRQTDLFR
jgi:uncharacterized protein YecE (DUF72 family)